MAPSKPKTPTLPPPATPRNRDSSPELGSPSNIIQYNKQTGRPVRKSAGQIKKVAGFVDFEDDEFGPLTTDESEEEVEEDMEARGRSDKKKRVQKRNNEQDGAFHRNAPKKPPITLQFNVPLGFHGPLFVKLDSTLLQTNKQGTLHEMQPGKSKKVRSSSPQPKQTSVVRHKGFTDLPPEVSAHIGGADETSTNLVLAAEHDLPLRLRAPGR
jgi:hypothetical protein